ncbi:vWA domain-containing protein [Haloparvum sedimenti]|uniref:vWA domain-containing protein n=1 Tax=Haloparvum sedimenti TaxID=1678448 RepID=UPI00071E7342|nr:vWA domain-containing protein [Haloparvum sedimenti]
MRLTPETPSSDLAALATAERTSDRRRRELERLAGICSPRRVDVSVRLDPQVAAARPGEAAGSYEIRIPTTRYEQVGDALPDPVWDRRMQIALLFHELGHVHYSDFERFGDRLDEVDERWRELFRAVYNAAEDAVVETQMAAEFNVRADLLALNAALAARADDRHARFVRLFADGETSDSHDPVRSYTLFEAVTVGLLDRGFGDSGRYAALRDPDDPSRVVRNGRDDVLATLAPVLDDYCADMLSEPNATRRVDRADECFREVRDALASFPPLQRTRIQTAAVRPRDARAAARWPARNADRLPDGETAARRVARTGETGSEAGGSGATSGPVPGEVTTGAIERLVRRRSATSGRGARRSGSPLRREAERLLSVVRDPDASVDEVVVVDPAADGGDRERWAAATAEGRGLAADLRTQLRRERRPRTDSGHRVGRLDSGRLVDAYRGQSRVFSKRLPGRQKDYSCLLLLDRSGSMRGEPGRERARGEGPMRTAENAVAQLAAALYDVGVDISVLSVWRGKPCLELPFGGDPGDHVDRLLTGRADGGTPLAALLTLARHRIAYGAGAVPFVVVVTDGRPDDEDAYADALERCSFPVYGVYLSGERDGDPAFFDRLVHASPDDLGRTLRRLARSFFAHGGG